jgi:hypothetical protein
MSERCFLTGGSRARTALRLLDTLSMRVFGRGSAKETVKLGGLCQRLAHDRQGRGGEDDSDPRLNGKSQPIGARPRAA